MDNYKEFLLILSSAGIAGFIAIVFVIRWVVYYQGGLAWDGKLAEFNWHPLLNICGFIFLQGLAIIVYRLPWTWKYSKLTMKFLHATLHLVAFISAVVATVAVFDFHNDAGIPNMYSLHSWLGLSAVLLYGLQSAYGFTQLVLGVGVYLMPFTPVSWRAAFMPIHTYSGLLLFGSVIAAALMGITEKLIFSLSTDPKYKDLPPQAIFVNTLGLLLVIFGALIFWIATRQSWKRPSEQFLHSLHSERGSEVDPKVGPVLSQLSDGAEGEEALGEVRRRSNKFDDQVN